jgi:hypothetical protein
MGRASEPVSGKCRLQKVPFVDQCYDRGGAYWGLPDNLYVCEDKERKQAFVRGKNRSWAKLEIWKLYGRKEITFYN